MSDLDLLASLTATIHQLYAAAASTLPTTPEAADARREIEACAARLTVHVARAQARLMLAGDTFERMFSFDSVAEQIG